MYAKSLYLKQELEGKPQPLSNVDTPREDHPLLKDVTMPKRIADVFYAPPVKGTQIMRRSDTSKARVLTCEELPNEISERDQKRKLAPSEKEQKKIIRLEKRTKKDTQKEIRQTKRRTRTRKRMPTSKPSEVAATSIWTPTTVSASTATNKSIVTKKSGNQCELFFSNLQATLCACCDYASMEQFGPIELTYPLPSVPQRSIDNESSQRDPVPESLIVRG